MEHYICKNCAYTTKRTERRCHICGKSEWLTTTEDERGIWLIQQQIHAEKQAAMNARAEANIRRRNEAKS